MVHMGGVRLFGTGASPKFSCGYHGLVLVHAQREHVVAPPRSLNERQTASFGHKNATCDGPAVCAWMRVALFEHCRCRSNGTHEQQPRECLPVQVES